MSKKDAKAWQPFSQPDHWESKENQNEKSNTILNYFTKISSSTSSKKRKRKEDIAVVAQDVNGNNIKRQTYINIGQKNFGHVKCPTCGMLYSRHIEDEEAQHTRYHQKLVDKLQFNGWKDENVLEEFPDGRIIVIGSDDHASHLKKLQEIREVVDTELGFAGLQTAHPDGEQQSYLFVSREDKKVVGCAIAVHISKAYPIIGAPTVEKKGVSVAVSDKDKENHAENNAVDGVVKEKDESSSWCCSTDSVSAICGITRIWVYSDNRKQKIASRLVDSVRLNFLYGCVVQKEKLAFSDPTPNGRAFAEKYMGKLPVLVFR